MLLSQNIVKLQFTGDKAFIFFCKYFKAFFFFFVDTCEYVMSENDKKASFLFKIKACCESIISIRFSF